MSFRALHEKAFIVSTPRRPLCKRPPANHACEASQKEAVQYRRPTLPIDAHIVFEI